VPEKDTLRRARADKRAGKSPSTQAGEFVREEIHHVREGKHGARSTKQAIAIGLSKARRAGVELRAPPTGRVSKRTHDSAARAYRAGHEHTRHEPSPARSRATHRALEREPHRTASHLALARQAGSQARRRSAADRSRAAMRAVRTKGPTVRRRAARKAAATRARHQ
jgi:hypothetical protein